MAALRWQTSTRYYQVKVQRDLFGALLSGDSAAMLETLRRAG